LNDFIEKSGLKMKTGLVLSGGGARGVAHLGAIQALLDHGIKPDIISGVSSGSIVGSLYGAGMMPEEILEILTKTKLFRYIRPAWSKFGFLNIQKLIAIYKLYLPVKTFEDLKYPVIISAADIIQGKTVYFSQGDLVKAVLASTCIPLLFAPVEMDGMLMVDGGIINNLPVEPLIPDCNLIIGVHCNPANHTYKPKGMKSMIERTFHLAVSNNVKERIKYCDIFIEPAELVNTGLFEISKAREIYSIGYEHTVRVLEQSADIIVKKQSGI
jgi:NTE family protein